MPELVLSEVFASISELKKNPIGTVAAGNGFAVAILSRNKPVFYCIPAKTYEVLMDKIDDLEMSTLADARANEKIIMVKLDGL